MSRSSLGEGPLLRKQVPRERLLETPCRENPIVLIMRIAAGTANDGSSMSPSLAICRCYREGAADGSFLRHILSNLRDAAWEGTSYRNLQTNLREEGSFRLTL